MFVQEQKVSRVEDGHYVIIAIIGRVKQPDETRALGKCESAEGHVAREAGLIEEIQVAVPITNAHDVIKSVACDIAAQDSAENIIEACRQVPVCRQRDRVRRRGVLKNDANRPDPLGECEVVKAVGIEIVNRDRADRNAR